MPIADPIDVDCILAEAIAHHQAGRSAEAERDYRRIIAAGGNYAAASYNFGVLCHAAGRLQDAMDAYANAIAIHPGYVDALINMGAVQLDLGRREQAVELYRQAILVCPDNAMAHVNLGKALQDLGRIDEAVAAYRNALEHDPNNSVVSANLGSALLESHDWNGSVATTKRAIALDPSNILAHANLGTALLHLGRHDEALAACRAAIALQPQSAFVFASIGGAMLELGVWAEAAHLCQQAITLDPALPNAHFNLSHALKALNRPQEAADAARRAIALRPDSAEYHFHLGHILLLQGDMENGWPEYDWRWQLPDFTWLAATHGIFAQPVWTGEDIATKTILIYTEQGLGDIIQFARYLPLVVQKAAHVIVAAHPGVERILASIDGITIVPVHQPDLPRFDVYCPLMSLPRAFATRLDTIPATVPYLNASPAEQTRWSQRIAGQSPRVGIVWAGNPATKRDRIRSPGFASIAPLLANSDIDFVILQVGPGRGDLDNVLLPPNVIDLGRDITDLAETAAIMSRLDLMISSCTGPLHLAGALAVPTWAMIPFAPYFTWLLDGTDSPWYPSVRLYRQARPGQDWSDVVARIDADLAEWLRSSRTVVPNCSQS